jgi:hypothetical protein
MSEPRLRTAQKITPPYPINDFPKDFTHSVGMEIIFMLATSRHPSLEGSEWERIFAKAIDAEWKPSNVGLDDVVKGSFAWGAKTVGNSDPHGTTNVRLISGRNNPEYSFGNIADTDDGVGAQVLQIWNGRVEGLRNKFKELRTIVLLKPFDFTAEQIAFSAFEFETVRYPEDRYRWEKNKNDNLEGFDKETGEHKFTWQRHGSQFTIKEPAPANRLKFFVKRPSSLDGKKLLELVGYDSSWVEIAK